VIDVANEVAILDTPGRAGTVPLFDPDQLVVQYAAEGSVKFGRAVAYGTGARGGIVFSGSGDQFAGVARSATHASGYETEDAVSGTVGEYALNELMSVVDTGSVTVFVEEAVEPGDDVRVRFAQEAETSGHQDITISEGFTGSFVPEIVSETYDLDITVDGTLRQVSFTVAPTDDWDTIAASIQAALRVLTSSTETVAVTSSVMRVTSATTGDSSTVVIEAGTAGSSGGDFLTVAATLETTGSQAISSTPTTFVGATVPAISAETYDLDVSADTVVVRQLSVAITASDDWDTIAAALQAALRAATGGSETVVVTGGEIVGSSGTQGAGSSIRITAGTAGSAGGDLLTAIDGLVGYTTTVEDEVDGRTIATGITTLTAVDGADDPSPLKEPGNFATTAEAGKTALLSGCEFKGRTPGPGLVALSIIRPITKTND
jgi:hypothetical protein